MTSQKPGRPGFSSPSLPWRKPTIIDLGIRVPPKENNWTTFLKIIGEHSKSQGTFPIVYPEVKIVPTRVIRNRATSRVRMRDLRERRRTKEYKRGDPVSFISVPLRESIITLLTAELKIKKNIQNFSDREWVKLIGGAAALALARYFSRK
jgi:hypothetical protein